MDDVLALDVLQYLDYLSNEKTSLWLGQGLSLLQDIAERLHI